MLNRRATRLILLIATFLVALGMRSGFNFDLVFRDDGVHFQEPDGYFHMRTIRNLMHHFPKRSSFDPYSAMPTGQPVTTGPFYDLAIGTTAWIAGLGTPSANTIDITAAWFPAVMGALITVPVYVAGVALFDAATGLIAALLVGILPGALLNVSRLGFTDHHVAESFLAAVSLAFLVLAIQGNHTKLTTVLAGLSLGCFLVNRPVGAFLIAFLALWAVLQTAWNKWCGAGSRVCLIVGSAILIAWLLFLPVGPIIWSQFTFLALGAGLASVAFAGLLEQRIQNRYLYLAILAVLCLAGVAGISWWKPNLLPSLWASIVSREGDGPASTVWELRPLLTKYGKLSWQPAWEEFTTTWLFALPALAILIWRNRTGLNPALTLFLAWSALMLALSLAQNRNCYFLAVHMAILAAWTCRELLRVGKIYERAVLSVLLIGVLAVPNLARAVNLAEIDTSPSSDWNSTFVWLRTHTPEPFGGTAEFDRYVPAITPGTSFPYPPSAYGIMAWWDYGHWISAQARRIPVSNGMQTGADDAARFYLTSNPEEAGQILQRTRSRYVVADATLVVPLAKDLNQASGKILAMATWLRADPRELADVFLSEKHEGGMEPVVVYYPKYYESMLSRLYLFDGESQQPDSSTWVIGYTEADINGVPHQRTITSQTLFKTYQEAADFMRGVQGEKFVLAGLNPIRTCVPLKKLDGYQLVYSTQPGSLARLKESIHALKVFEYSGPR